MKTTTPRQTHSRVARYTHPSEAKIRARWQLDPMPVKATRANIKLAVRRTRNSFGITCQGRPYVDPFVGMSVESSRGEAGTILAVRKPMQRNGDPEVQIRTATGRTIYLFQTAINGYTALPSPVAVAS